MEAAGADLQSLLVDQSTLLAMMASRTKGMIIMPDMCGGCCRRHGPEEARAVRIDGAAVNKASPSCHIRFVHAMCPRFWGICLGHAVSIRVPSDGTAATFATARPSRTQSRSCTAMHACCGLLG